MASLSTRIGRWWYTPAPVDRLATLRVLIGSFALWYVFTRADNFERTGRSAEALFAPVGLFRIFAEPMDPVANDWLVWITVISGFAFVLGMFYRVSGPLFGVCLALTLMYRNSWSMTYHMNNGLVVHVLILGFTRAGDALGVDALRAGRALDRREDPRYGWPIRLICAVTAIGYVLAGVAKLASSHGLQWAHGTIMREQIAADTIRKEVLEGYGMSLAYTLWDNIWLFTLIGIGTYVLELGAPLALASRWIGRLWAVSVWMMHWGILLIMGIRFRYQLSGIAFAPFFPVEVLPRGIVAAWHRLRGSQAQRASPP